MNNDQKDERLWRIAKKRVAFKHTFLAYFIVNAFLVAVWYFNILKPTMKELFFLQMTNMKK